MNPTEESPVDWVNDIQSIDFESFAEHFLLLQDPRTAWKTGHNLLESIVVTVCAYICGANSWTGVVEFCNERLDWLRSFLTLKNGPPSRVTLWRIFSQLSTSAFQKSFANWVQSLCSLHAKHVAIDGKCLRGVYDKADEDVELTIVSAWATKESLLLGQVRTESKSNEITAIPKLLDIFQVRDRLISIDAIGCQTGIAQKIHEAGGDYLLALKGNQGNLQEDIELYFQGALKSDWKKIDYEKIETLEKGHGRIEQRITYCVRDVSWLDQRERWAGLSAVLMVLSSRTVKGKESSELRYYITSSGESCAALASSIRNHWGIENGLHWCLDVGFREDRQVANNLTLAENLATLRRIAFTFLKNEKKTGLSIENKRLKAAMNPCYLEDLLGIKKNS